MIYDLSSLFLTSLSARCSLSLFLGVGSRTECFLLFRAATKDLIFGGARTIVLGFEDSCEVCKFIFDCYIFI